MRLFARHGRQGGIPSDAVNVELYGLVRVIARTRFLLALDEMTLAEIDALILSATTRGVTSVAVDGQSVTFMSLSELIELRRRMAPGVSAASLLGNRVRLIPAPKE